MTELVPGGNVALPGGAVTVRVPGPFDVSALITDDGGKVRDDGDFVFYNQPAAPGARLRGDTLVVDPARLRPGATRVTVAVSPAEPGAALSALPSPTLHVTDAPGHALARFTPPRPGQEAVLLLAELYRRGDRWKLRALGQGYADGLAGLARDFGVEVVDETPAPEPRPQAPPPSGRPEPAPGSPPPSPPGSPAGPPSPPGNPAGSAPPPSSPAGSPPPPSIRAGSTPPPSSPAGSAPPPGNPAGSLPPPGNPAGSAPPTGNPAGSAPPPSSPAGSPPPPSNRAGSAPPPGTPAGSPPPTRPSPGASSPAASDPDGFLPLVNSARADAGSPPVSLDARLVSAAREHAAAMAAAGRLGVETRDGVSVYQRVIGAGYTYLTIDEHLVSGPRTTAEFVAYCLRAEAPRRSVQEPAFRHAGVARVHDDRSGDTYWTALWAAPLTPSGLERTAAAVTDLTNRARTRAGLPPLAVDPLLTAAARAHSADMVARAFYAHTAPDGSRPGDRAAAAGSTLRAIGENIACGQRSPADVVEGWMNSPGHRANILRPEFTRIGIGFACGGRAGTYWTQMFGG
ncbi:CAP domain-containing protein [Streptomyces sp. NPDC057794]|uniref:CAP domain-containing protein n=1 Tax=Streptomyces sp. NPDC057794 TaxID=3346251 RepID=UPI0036762334